MGKVPAIRHSGHVVTEVRRDLLPISPTLSPPPGSARATTREPITTVGCSSLPGRSRPRSRNQAVGWDPTPERERMFGYGNFDKVVAVLDELFSLRDYVCGDRFTAADVYSSARRSSSRCSSTCCPSRTGSSATATA